MIKDRQVSINIGGILLPGMFLLFLYLKLTGAITWSWWWVTAPLWGGFAFVVVFFVLLFLVATIVAAFSKKKRY